MSLESELKSKVREIFTEIWDTHEGYLVPDPEDIGLGNEGIELDATVLYSDLAESTDLVKYKKAEFAAEIYKTYLHCAAKIIRSEGGEITAYDGDRIMAVFLGTSKNTEAVRAALKINYAVWEIINPRITDSYPSNTYHVKHSVGIDTSELLVARTGIRGSNDLVWVGRAANYAAKLCGLRYENYATYITEEVYGSMSHGVTFAHGTNMWEARDWTAMNDKTIYRSKYRWSAV